MVLVPPGAKQGAEKRGHAHRPADYAKHAKPEPRTLRSRTLRFSLTRDLHGNLGIEVRFAIAHDAVLQADR